MNLRRVGCRARGGFQRGHGLPGPIGEEQHLAEIGVDVRIAPARFRAS